ncbi:hypothetical protein RZE82_01865 [Mollicutes bacterium LVI A0039]|nr:hypothetical protein RZE82_01865 [Mollicutes bacterium LVI A0039]
MPNVTISEDRIVINNFTDIAKNVYDEIDELNNILIANQNKLDKLSYGNVLSTKYVELYHAIPKISEQISVKQQLIKQMQSLYKHVHKLSKNTGVEIGKEIVFIQSLVTSEKWGISRELISRGLDIKLNLDDYSIEISFTDIVTLETDAFDIA